MTKREPFLARYLFPRLQDVLFISLLAVVILHGPRLLNQDGDLGRHLTIGRYILENGKIPLNDLFSHTMHGAPLVPHEWLSQVLFALAYKFLGLDGPVLLTGLLVALTFILVYRETLRRGAFRLTALAVVLLAAAASSLHWLARPHVFTFLLLTLWTFELEKFSRQESRSLFQFPLIMWVWANTHGAFIAGFVVLGVYIIEWAFELKQGRSSIETGIQYGLIAAASLLVTLINPAGWNLWFTSVGYVGNDYLVNHTVEYMAPDFHNPSLWPFLFLLAFGLSALAWGRQLRPRDGMLLAAWAAMGLYSARNIPLFAIISAPLFGDLLQSPVGRVTWLANLDRGLQDIEKQLGGFFWPALGVISVLILYWQDVPLDFARQGNSFDPAVFPVQAEMWLDDNPQQGNAFNEFTWGGYLLYSRWPEHKVFIDGQTDFYGESFTREYAAVVSVSPTWEEVLRKYNSTWAIIPTNSDLALAMREAGWDEIYADSTAVIFRKP